MDAEYAHILLVTMCYYESLLDLKTVVNRRPYYPIMRRRTMWLIRQKLQAMYRILSDMMPESDNQDMIYETNESIMSVLTNTKLYLQADIVALMQQKRDNEEMLYVGVCGTTFESSAQRCEDKIQVIDKILSLNCKTEFTFIK